MTAKGKLRTSYEFTPENKVRLTQLKLDLKAKGLAHVSEATILETLIRTAKLEKLEAEFRGLQDLLRTHRSLMLQAAADERRAKKTPKKARRRR